MNKRSLRNALRSLAILLSAAISICSLVGCAVGGASFPAAESAKPPPQDLTLFFSRTSANVTEFEQYTMRGTDLLWECGTTQRGRNVPAAQDLRILSIDSISVTIAPLLHEIDRSIVTKGANLPKPGKDRNLADPGRYLLNFTLPDRPPLKIETSFDAVVNGETGLPLDKLAWRLRSLAATGELNDDASFKVGETAIGQVLCDNSTFFGLGARSQQGDINF
jgi:hypothetical protein